MIIQRMHVDHVSSVFGSLTQRIGLNIPVAELEVELSKTLTAHTANFCNVVGLRGKRDLNHLDPTDIECTLLLRLSQMGLMSS